MLRGGCATQPGHRQTLASNVRRSVGKLRVEGAANLRCQSLRSESTQDDATGTGPKPLESLF